MGHISIVDMELTNINPFRTSSCPATLGQIDRGTGAAHQVMWAIFTYWVCSWAAPLTAEQTANSVYRYWIFQDLTKSDFVWPDMHLLVMSDTYAVLQLFDKSARCSCWCLTNVHWRSSELSAHFHCLAAWADHRTLPHWAAGIIRR